MNRRQEIVAAVASGMILLMVLTVPLAPYLKGAGSDADSNAPGSPAADGMPAGPPVAANVPDVDWREVGLQCGVIALLAAVLLLAFHERKSSWIRRRGARGRGLGHRVRAWVEQLAAGVPPMNPKQEIVLVLAALVVVAMVHVPPWAQYAAGTDERVSNFYRPVFLPIKSPSLAEAEALEAPYIDWPRFGFQVSVVVLVTTLLLLAFRERRLRRARR